jgi:hypothetical protein
MVCCTHFLIDGSSSSLLLLYELCRAISFVTSFDGYDEGNKEEEALLQRGMNERMVLNDE